MAARTKDCALHMCLARVPNLIGVLADFDIRNVFHLSGSYELPFGKNKKYMANIGKLGNQVLGGWSVNWIATLQGGQPIYLSCPSGTTSGTSCNTLKVPGQSQKTGLFTKNEGSQINLFWFGNPKAFNQPCQLDASGNPSNQPTGCVPLGGPAALGDRPGQPPGPGVRRFDFSAFKGFQISDRILDAVPG